MSVCLWEGLPGERQETVRVGIFKTHCLYVGNLERVMIKPTLRHFFKEFYM